MHPLVRALAILGAPIAVQPAAFGSPAPPPPPPPQPMPDLNDPAVLAAQDQAAQQALARSGRLSTILTAGGSGNGSSGTYAGAKLGSS